MTDDLESRAEQLAERVRRAAHFVTLAGAVSETTAAEIIGVKPRTLRAWRKNGTGPRCYMTRRAFYPLVEIVRFLDETSNAGGSARQCAAPRGSTRHFTTSTKRAGRGR